MSEQPSQENPMDSKDLTEHTLDSQRVYEGKLLKINKDRVRLPDGGESAREYVEHPGAVAIIPVLDNGKLIMERQYRYPLRRHFIEFPAGKIDPGEADLATAKRELLEETGYSAAEWHYLTTVHPLIAYSDERIEVYLAKGLTRGERKLDPGEFLEVLEVEFEQAMQWVREGKVSDPKTVIGLFWVEKMRSGQWQPGERKAAGV